MFPEIENKFFELCENYYDNNGFLFFSKEVDKDKSIAIIELNIIKIEFCYIKKGSIFIEPSNLFCRIYLNKNSPIFFHLTDILSELRAKDFRCTYFSFIENSKRMELCFNQLVSILDEHLQDIDNLALNKCNEMQEKQIDFIRKAYKLKEKDLNMSDVMTNEDGKSDFVSLQDWYEIQTVNRFTSDTAYHRFLLGDFKISKKIYIRSGKKEPLLPYEQDLLAFMETEECKTFKPIPDECFSQKIGLREQSSPSGMFLLYSLVAYVPCAIAFCLIFAIANFFLSRGTVFCLSVPVLLGLIPAAVTAIFGGMAFRNTISKIIYRKNAELIIEIDKITNSKASDIFIKVIFIGALAFGVYTSLMMLTSNVRFYEDKLVYNKGEYWMDYQECEYTDIKGFYFVESYIADDGSEMDDNSYVIGFQDNYTHSFYDEDCDGLVEFMESKGCEVTYVESNEVLVEMGYDY